jgi:hypothetical protein
MTEQDTTHHALFNLIDQVLLGECGDGDVHVHCKYRSKENMADEFEKYLKRLQPEQLRLRRYPYSPEHKVILFSDGSNENVTFSDAIDRVPVASWVSLEVSI